MALTQSHWKCGPYSRDATMRWPHYLLSGALHILGIPHYNEYPLLQYWADILFPGPVPVQLVIEVNGASHNDRVERDQIRADRLRQRNIEVLPLDNWKIEEQDVNQVALCVCEKLMRMGYKFDAPTDERTDAVHLTFSPSGTTGHYSQIAEREATTGIRLKMDAIFNCTIEKETLAPKMPFGNEELTLTVRACAGVYMNVSAFADAAHVLRELRGSHDYVSFTFYGRQFLYPAWFIECYCSNEPWWSPIGLLVTEIIGISPNGMSELLFQSPWLKMPHTRDECPKQ